MYKKLFYINYIYGGKIFSKFINNLMDSGKKEKIELSIYLILKIIKFRIKSNPIIILFEVLEKLKPVIDLKTLIRRRKRKKIKDIIPFEINILSQYKRSNFLLIDSIKKVKYNYYYIYRLIEELVCVFFFNYGNSIKKKFDFYKHGKLSKYRRFFRW